MQGLETDGAVKLYTTPEVYVVGHTAPDLSAIKQFVKRETQTGKWEPKPHGFMGTPGPDLLAEIAGRVCYMSFDGTGRDTQDYFGNILASKHGSVLEHATFNFILTGISRTCTHELVRHRAGWGYSQLSQRYVDSKDAGCVVPPAILALPDDQRQKELKRLTVKFSEALQEYDRLTEMLGEQYKHLGATVARKQAREAARSVLPNETETKIFCTANARALRHFFELRGSVHAEAEIRRLAIMLFERIQPLAPFLFPDITRGTAQGKQVLKVHYPKV